MWECVGDDFLQIEMLLRPIEEAMQRLGSVTLAVILVEGLADYDFHRYYSAGHKHQLHQ
jgi:hypothetical protein